MKVTLKKLVLTGAMTVGLAALVPTVAWGLQGVCSNCHTMHNSQNGASMQLNTSSLSATRNQLLRADGCVGCHASPNYDNADYDGGAATNIPPQVDNSGLAGGYFSALWNDDQHNLDNNDTTGASLLTGTQSANDADAPGSGGAGIASLTCAGVAGGIGCHYASQTHHQNDTGNVAATSNASSYRFLDINGSASHVKGVEDDNYQYSGATHNVYHAEARAQGAAATDGQTIGAFCAGCHGDFHAATAANQGGGATWVRHPTDFSLQDGATEHDNYTNYLTTVPVGADTDVYTTSALQDAQMGAAGNANAKIVICMSCHVAHGSGQPDMLRWDYDTMIAGNGGAAAGTGCFACHSDKD